MSNLRLINETTVSSSVTSVNVTDVFSADFDVYKIVYNNFFADGQDNMNLSFINSFGSEVRGSSDYGYADLNCQTNSSSFTQSKDASNDDIQSFAVIGNSSGESANGVIYVFNPFTSNYTYVLQQSSSSRATVNQNKKGIGLLKQSSSITGFSFFIHGSDSFTSGVIKTYGLRVDS